MRETGDRMDDVTREVLTAALARADRGACEVLADLLSAGVAEADGEFSEIRELPGGQGQSGCSGSHDDLADRLLVRAAGSASVRSALRLWLTAARVGEDLVGDALPAAAGAAISNTIGGRSRIIGPAIQAGDISGGIHMHHHASSARPPVPRQLLPEPPGFTGRLLDLAALEAMRTRADSTRLIVVTGTAGVGKTALASHWLHKVSTDYPDGQLYADLHGYSGGEPTRPGAVLGGFLRAFGMAHVPARIEEQAALWRTVSADRRIAVLLDNPVSAAQVRPLLPASDSALVVVTSRSRLAGLAVDGAEFHHLDVLDPAAAVELLSRRLGAERVAGERQAAFGLAQLCAGLPLAVCIAAARMTVRPRRPLSDMVAAMRRESERLALLDAGEDRAVLTALDDSYRELPLETASMYRHLGALPVTEFGAETAAAASGLVPERAERLVEGLVDANLLEDLGPDRFRFHDLVRLHARQRAVEQEPAAARTQVVSRVVDYYLATATTARHLLSPTHRRLRRDYHGTPHPVRQFGDGREALAWYDTERQHLMALVRTAAQRGWDAAAWQLVDSMQPLFLRLRPYDLWIEAHRIGLAAAERAGHPDGVSRMLTTGGSGLYNAGRYDEAGVWFARALEDGRRNGDLRAQAQALHGIGQARRLADRLDEASDSFRQALALREAIGYVRGAALTRVCLGDIALQQGRAREAVDLFTRARADLLAVPDPYDAARALAFLGRAYAAPGIADFAVAERQLDQALAEFSEAGSAYWQGRVLEFLGQAAEEQGDRYRARDCYARSLALYTPVSLTDVRRLEDRLRLLEDGQSNV